MTAPYPRPVLVHVGFPKTLSSWLQEKWFRPENGFLTVMDPVRVQLDIIDPTPFRFSIDGALHSIEAAEQGADEHLTPVITSEALSGHMFCGGFDGKENIERVAKLATRAKILLIVREQRALIRSLYKTLINFGNMPHSIDRVLQPVAPRFAPQFNLDFLRFDTRVAYYQRLFGRDNVKVLPYESFVENPADFLRRVSEFAGVQEQFASRPSEIRTSERINPGIPLGNIHLIRWYNRFFLNTPFNYAEFPLSGRLLRKGRPSLKKIRIPRRINKRLEKRFAEKVLVNTRGKFGASNRRLRALTGLDLGSYGYEL